MRSRMADGASLSPVPLPGQATQPDDGKGRRQRPASSPFQLFQRPGSSNWQVRFSIPGEGQIRRSLRGAKDSAEAERMALQVYAEALHRAKLGLRSRSVKFRDVAEMFVAALEREVARGERRGHELT